MYYWYPQQEKVIWNPQLQAVPRQYRLCPPIQAVPLKQAVPPTQTVLPNTGCAPQHRLHLPPGCASPNTGCCSIHTPILSLRLLHEAKSPLVRVDKAESACHLMLGLCFSNCGPYIVEPGWSHSDLTKQKHCCENWGLQVALVHSQVLQMLM